MTTRTLKQFLVFVCCLHPMLALAQIAGGPTQSTIAPAAAPASMITTGGTAVMLVAGPCHGGFIINPIDAAAEGISTTENVYIDMVAIPGGTDTTANGTAAILLPGQEFIIPPLSAGNLIYGNAATGNHKLTVVVW